jgi:hypothetical protein
MSPTEDPAVPRRLTSGCLARIRAAMAGEHGERGIPFVEAVVEQVAHPLGDAPADAEAAEARVTAEVIAILHAAEGPDGADAARRLRGDAVLLSALFANIDLLFLQDSPVAEGVAGIVMGALEEVDVG